MSSRIASLAFCLIALSGFAAACGGGQPEPAQPSNPPAASEAPAASSAPPAESAAPAPSASAAAPAASEAPASTAPPGPGEWDKWSHDQKMAYMKAAVAPKMGALFHDFDATRYAEPKCVLCHGSGAKDGSFKMPNPELPKLDLTPAGFKAMSAKHAKVVEFMAKQVVPTMAQLLGEQPYDPKTKQGFGCVECHTKK